MNTYDLFSGKDLEIAEKIQQRRLQLLVHSCIYYHLNSNIISDMIWDKWAKELVLLQKKYPHISSNVWLSTEFEDWDASTGAFLPITENWVIQKSKSLLYKLSAYNSSSSDKKATKRNVKQITVKRKLF